MLSNEETIKVLNDLVETSKDGEYGFRLCAEHVESRDLKDVLMQRAVQCRASAEELQWHIAQLGGRPDTTGTATGAAHRGWVAMRATLATYNDLAMLEECERGEDTAVKRYAKAVEQDLPPVIHGLVMAQYDGVRRNHDLVRNLRDRLEAVT